MLIGAETLKLGITNLRLHKLRSLLTALGIIFGVAAVICMLSISEGASADEMRMIELMGTQNIIINSTKPEGTRQASEGNTRMLAYGITHRDVDVIRATIPGVERIVPLRTVSFAAAFKDRLFQTTIEGTTPDLFDVINIDIAQGRALTVVDLEARAKVCVIGDEVRRELFAYEDPIGQSIIAESRSAGGKPYTVVGVMAPVQTAGSPARGVEERDLNRDIFIPLTTADARYGSMIVKLSSGTRELLENDYSTLYVRAASMDYVLPVSEMVKRVFESGHDKQDYEVRVPLARLRLAEKEKANRQVTLGIIAGVSLLVGGIGIMNIMLASVTERTREIGIRRALGAKQRHITMQFLVETVVLSTSGGVLGVAMGCAGAILINRLVGWDTIIQPWTIVVSFGLSVLVGIFFGMYPAMSAARLDPIEALRHE